MSNDYFLIESSVLEDSSRLCCAVKDKTLKNRAISDVLASKIALRFFGEADVDVESGLHQIPKILEELDIADIYVKGNNFINVCLCTSEDCLLIPKSHFDMGVLPVAYMFIKVESDLSSGNVIGFAITENMETKTDCGDYYRLDENELVSYYDVEALLSTVDDAELPAQYDCMIIDYLDGKIELSKDFINMLISSKEARNFLIAAYDAKIKISGVNFDIVQESNDTNEEVNSESAISEIDETGAGFDLDMNDAAEDLGLDDQSGVDTEFLEPAEETLEEFSDSSDITDLNSFEVDSPEDLSLPADDEIEDLESESLPEDTDNAEDIIESDETESGDIIDNSLEDTAGSVIDTLYDENSETEDLDTAVNELQSEQDEEATDVGSSFNYSTETTPSLNTIETENEDFSDDEDNKTDSEELLSDLSDDVEKEEVVDSTYDEEVSDETSEEQIDTLFGDENEEQSEVEEQSSEAEIGNVAKPKKPSLIYAVAAVAVIAGLGYFVYDKVMPKQSQDMAQPPATAYNSEEAAKQSDDTAEDAMPVETVENVKVPEKTEEGNAVSIPAIEQNLDASILVSNLSVNWEVPSSYASNSTARRYFVKIGKVLQLNLKTELLLLSRPPITNKIAVEVEFDKASQKFNVKQINASSGEKQVDDTILKTVKSVLNINLGMNMSVFENLPGNPVLVIKL